LIVETRHYAARNAAIGGAIAGFLRGLVGSCADDGDDGGCSLEIGAAFAGIGAGAGGLVGALYDWKTARSHIVYAASAARARVTPLMAPGGAGVAIALKF
jgi:hypothetical protein